MVEEPLGKVWWAMLANWEVRKFVKLLKKLQVGCEHCGHPWIGPVPPYMAHCGGCGRGL